MTLDELKQHDLWHKATGPQQKFIQAYIKQHGDKLKTGRAVWNAKTDLVIKDMVNRALRKPAVRKLLATYQGADVADAVFPMTKRELSDLIARRLRIPQGITHAAFIRLSELFMYLRGWDPAAITNAPAIKPPAATGRGDSVDDLVLAMERKAREE